MTSVADMASRVAVSLFDSFILKGKHRLWRCLSRLGEKGKLRGLATESWSWRIEISFLGGFLVGRATTIYAFLKYCVKDMKYRSMFAASLVK